MPNHLVCFDQEKSLARELRSWQGLIVSFACIDPAWTAAAPRTVAPAAWLLCVTILAPKPKTSKGSYVHWLKAQTGSIWTETCRARVQLSFQQRAERSD